MWPVLQPSFKIIQVINTFFFSVVQYPITSCPYPPNDAAPPYPTGPNVFPIPPSNQGTIGFSVPNPPTPFSGNNTLAGVHAPSGYQASSSSSTQYPTANAPNDSSAPSAPSKAELAAGDDFIMLDGKY